MLHWHRPTILNYFRDIKPTLNIHIYCIRIATLTFQGHVTPSVTWSLDLPYTISYNVLLYNQQSLSNRFRDIKAQMYLGHDPDLSRSCDVIDHVTIRLPLDDFLYVLHWHRPTNLNCFRDIKPIVHRNHDLDLSRSRDVTSHVTIRFAIYTISYRCSIGTNSLSPTDFEILRLKCI